MQDKMKILEMIEQKIITPEEGAKLLKAVDEPTQEVITNKPTKMLKIKVDSADGDKVNITIPIEFARVAMKSSMVQVDKLDEFDIDLDAVLQMIDSGAVGNLIDVETADGDVVKIYVE